MRRISAPIGLWVCVLGLVGAGKGDPVSFHVKTEVAAGSRPTIEIQAVDRVRNLHLSLTRDDGLTVSESHPALAPGQRVTFSIGDGKAGQAHYRGTLALEVAGAGPWSFQLEFDTVVRAPMTIGYDFEHLDLSGHVLRFQLSRPAARAELEVMGETGEVIGRGAATYQPPAPPQSWTAVSWTQGPGNVLKLRLKVTSAEGLAAAVDLFPWSLTIEHEDVNFATDSAVIAPSEAAKLDASLRRIGAAAHRVERFVKVRLYVAGHTDTVGTREHNRRLSLLRAHAIAEYFRKHGLALPIAYEGFGEEVPRVETPDETDEPRNRRADYVLGAAGAPPPAQLAGRHAVHADWKQVP
jgi:outer membrane protein OmpA-like peptidoglycan-associated protein